MAKLKFIVRLGKVGSNKDVEEQNQELVQSLHERLRECEKQADDPSDNLEKKKLKLPVIPHDSRQALLLAYRWLLKESLPFVAHLPSRFTWPGSSWCGM